MNRLKEHKLTKTAWTHVDNTRGNNAIHYVEMQFGCCGYDKQDQRLNMTNADWKMERDWCIEWVLACHEPPTTFESSGTKAPSPKGKPTEEAAANKTAIK